MNDDPLSQSVTLSLTLTLSHSVTQSLSHSVSDSHSQSVSQSVSKSLTHSLALTTKCGSPIRGGVPILCVNTQVDFFHHSSPFTSGLSESKTNIDLL